MKFKKYTMINEGKEIDDMLSFIVKNRKYINYEHNLREVWIEVAKRKFKSELGFYPEIQYGNFSIPDIGWELKGNYDYDKAVADFKKFQEGSAQSPKEMKEKTEFKHILEFAQWKSGNKITGIADYNLGGFFRFLRYVMFGRLDQNLKQGNEIVDTLRVKSGIMNAVPSAFPYTKLPDLKNIELKKFQNGAMQIKGMSNKDIAEAQRIMKLCSRYGN
jgi:hypothetical protein